MIPDLSMYVNLDLMAKQRTQLIPLSQFGEFATPALPDLPDLPISSYHWFICYSHIIRISYIKSWQRIPSDWASLTLSSLDLVRVKGWLFNHLPTGHAHR